jgi:hypothetical protein
MKKIALITALLFFAVGLALNAQMASTKSFTAGQTFYNYTPLAGDTIHGSDAASTTHFITFNVNRSKLYYFTIACELDTVKTHNRVLSNHVWVQVLGSMTNPTGNQGWVAIGSPVKFGASVDSTFSYSDVATGVLWKYLKVRFSGITAAKCSKLTILALKVADK